MRTDDYLHEIKTKLGLEWASQCSFFVWHLAKRGVFYDDERISKEMYDLISRPSDSKTKWNVWIGRQRFQIPPSRFILIIRQIFIPDRPERWVVDGLNVIDLRRQMIDWCKKDVWPSWTIVGIDETESNKQWKSTTIYYEDGEVKTVCCSTLSLLFYDEALRMNNPKAYLFFKDWCRNSVHREYHQRSEDMFDSALNMMSRLREPIEVNQRLEMDISNSIERHKNAKILNLMMFRRYEMDADEAKEILGSFHEKPSICKKRKENVVIGLGMWTPVHTHEKMLVFKRTKGLAFDIFRTLSLIREEYHLPVWGDVIVHDDKVILLTTDLSIRLMVLNMMPVLLFQSYRYDICNLWYTVYCNYFWNGDKRFVKWFFGLTEHDQHLDIFKMISNKSESEIWNDMLNGRNGWDVLFERKKNRPKSSGWSRQTENQHHRSCPDWHPDKLMFTLQAFEGLCENGFDLTDQNIPLLFYDRSICPWIDFNHLPFSHVNKIGFSFAEKHGRHFSEFYVGDKYFPIFCSPCPGVVPECLDHIVPNPITTVIAPGIMIPEAYVPETLEQTTIPCYYIEISHDKESDPRMPDLIGTPNFFLK